MSDTARLTIVVDSSQARNANKDLGALERGASSLASGLRGLIAPLIGVAGAMAALNKASEVQRQFDVLNAGLITATGSADKAAGAFKALQSFAQKTPYDLNQAVKGFTQLVNLGLTPSEKALMSYGNTASAMGKDLNQMIEAVADAATGEFERLKEFGIKAKANGDSLSLTFQGMTKKIGNNAAEIEKYLTDLGENQFAGAMELRMKTLDGAVANLGDTWDTTFRLINEAGLGDAMQDAVREATDALSELNDQIASGELETNLAAVAGKFDGFGRDIEYTLGEISKLFVDSTGYWGRTLDANVANMTQTFREFPENVRAFIQVMTVEVLAGFDKVKAYARAFNDGINAIFTNDTFEGVGARLEAELNVANTAREGTLQSIFDEREASLSSFAAQTQAAKDQRKAFDEKAAADAANTSDRLAQFKVVGEATKQQTDAEKKAAKEAESLAARQKKALDDLVTQADINTNSTNAMADAYLGGATSVRELTIQQKVEEELLKTGAGARSQVVDAINKEADARDRLDLSESNAARRVDTANTLSQAAATLKGSSALEEYNATKAITLALSGKKIAADSAEYKQLVETTKAQLAANKALQQAGKVESIVDRLSPQTKLLRDYTEEQEALNAAIALGEGDTALYQATLAKLAVEYEQNKNAATAWGQFTEGAVDRVDDAFADAWKNIDEGFDGFATSLKEGFKQLLAELAHMAITKPIIMQIGAAMGVGGLSASGPGGVLSTLTGGSSGSPLLSGIKTLADISTSSFGQALGNGWASGEGLFGGLQGAASNGYNFLSGIFAGGGAGAAASTGAAQGAAAFGSQFLADSGAATISFPGAAPVADAATGAAGAGWGSVGAIGSGLLGAYQGYKQNGLKGAVATGGLAYGGAVGGAALGGIAAGAISGTALGATIGSVVPVIGTVIGAALGTALGGKLFSGEWITKDMGLQLGVTDGELTANNYEYQKKKGGLFSSNKKRTKLSPLEDEQQTAMEQALSGTAFTAVDAFSRLGVQVREDVFDNFSVAIQQISTKDKTQEEIQAEITKFFTGVGDSMVQTIADATGELSLKNYDLAGLQAFVQTLFDVNAVLEKTNIKMAEISVGGAHVTEALVALSGGMEQLNTNAATYYENFISQAERNDDVLTQVGRQFAALNVAFPATRDGFKMLVESLDVTTDVGRQMYVTLMGLAGGAASAYTILEDRATAAAQAAADAAQALFDKMVGAAGTAQSAVQRAIAAEQNKATAAYNARVTSLNDMSSTASKSVSELTSVSSSLSNALKALRGDSDEAVKMLQTQARATLQSALATARSGGSLAGFSGLDDALSTVSENNTDLYGSMEDFARDQGRTANVVAELNAINGKQLTSAEKTVKALQDQLDQAKAAYDAQMAQFDAQLEFAQAQMDALNGVDNSIMGVTAAINAMNAAVLAALKGGVGSGSVLTPGNSATAIETAYQAILGRDADAAGLAYWQQQLASKAIGLTQLEEAIRNAAKANGSIPAFASGGMHTGGIRLVGEKGPELEVTGPSRIFNASQTAAMLRGGGANDSASVEELRGLRKEMEENSKYMSGQLKAMANHLDDIVNGGVQIVGTVETKAVA
jgi:hypothetical protein